MASQAFQVRVIVTLMSGILDPQGKAVEGALGHLGFSGVKGVRQGKVIDLAIEAESENAARQQARAMCDALLVNPVMESFEIAAIRAIDTASLA